MSLTDWPDPVPDNVRLVPREVTDPAIKVYLPSLDELARRWVEIEPLLDKATSRSQCYESIDCLAMAMAGQAGMWLCTYQGKLDAVIVTQLSTYPRQRVLEMLFCGGNNMRRWRKTAIEAVDRHARQLNCSYITAYGRRGWARAWNGKETGDVGMVREI